MATYFDMGLCSGKENRVLQTQYIHNKLLQELYKIILSARMQTNFHVDTTVGELIKWGGFKTYKTKRFKTNLNYN